MAADTRIKVTSHTRDRLAELAKEQGLSIGLGSVNRRLVAMSNRVRIMTDGFEVARPGSAAR